MANRYWTGAVGGGTGTWDTTSTTNWSATSGGAGGASAPTSADSVFFDAGSGSGVCTLGSDVLCSVFNLTGYTGTFAFSTFKVGVTLAPPSTATDLTLTLPAVSTALVGEVCRLECSTETDRLRWCELFNQLEHP